MCVMKSCLFCVKLSTATNLIAFIYMVWSLVLAMLFIVPVAVLDELPASRLYFYGAMAFLSLALFLACCLLVFAESMKKATLMWPWVLVACCTSMPLGVLCVVGMVTVSFRAADLQDVVDESIVISGYFTHALLLFCCACVVNSRRKELVREGYARANKRLMYPIMYNVDTV